MLSTSNLSAAQAENYYVQDDYYTQADQSHASHWTGKGAVVLGLTGTVEQVPFAALLAGFAPDGQLLSGKQVEAGKRRAATDYTFSAPKSVSLAALVQQDKRVLQAHHHAVRQALTVLEERYAQTRLATPLGRQRIKTGNLVAAVFTHATNREVEPQLHSHCVVINATQLPDGRWYSFSNEAAIAQQKLLGQIYQNELALALRQLGYDIQLRPHGQFDLVGYSPELLQLFSTRRQQITQLLAAWDAEGTAILDTDGQAIQAGIARREAANLRSRQQKPKAIDPDRLLRGWKAHIQLKGLTLPAIPEAKEEANFQQVVQSSKNIGTVIENAIQHCSEREAVFKQTQIERFVLEHHLGEQSFVALQEAIAANQELIQVEDGRYTTQAAINLELKTIRLMQAGKGQARAIASPEQVNTHLANKVLIIGQREAIQLASTTHDQFMAWQGVAGSGKTFALSEFKAIAQAQGYRVRGFAPSAEAAHGLGKMLQIETETVASLLLSQGRLLTNGDNSPLDGDRQQPEIWVVDEAGLLSMKEAHNLLHQATCTNARVILVGDTRQLSAVGAGNPFKSLQAGGLATARLDESLRQQTQALRAAVKLVAQGNVVEGIRTLEEARCIQEIPDDQERSQQMVNDYLRLSAVERQSTLLLAGTNQVRLTLTQTIRQGLQVEGSLGQDAFTVNGLRQKDVTTAQATYASAYAPGDIVVPHQDYRKQGLVKDHCYRVLANDHSTNQLTLETLDGQVITIDPATCEKKTVYQVQPIPVAVGDRLRWTKNNRTAGLRNGQTFTVQQVAVDGVARIVDRDGNTRSVNLSGNQYVDYAWVSTTYSSQGKTSDRVIALLDGMTTNQESFYVAISRAKHQLMLYTADIAALTQRAQQSKANKNVSDYIPLFQVYNDAQTQKTQTQASAAIADHRDLARQLGTRVGERLYQQLAATCSGNHGFATAGGRLGAGDTAVEDHVPISPSDLDRHVAPLSAAIASHFEQQAFLECAGEFAGAVAALDRRLEYLEHTAQSRSQLTAAVARLDAAIGRQTRYVESGKQPHSNQLPQPLAELRQIEAKHKRPSTKPHTPHLIPSAKQHYQQLWQQYSQGMQASNLVQLDYLVGRKAFEAGQSQKEIALILIAGSFQVQQMNQNQDRKVARAYANQTARMVCQRQHVEHRPAVKLEKKHLALGDE